MSPALGEEGNVTVTAPPVVLTKYPTLLAAVKGDVLAVVQNNTAEAGSPNPD